MSDDVQTLNREEKLERFNKYHAMKFCQQMQAWYLCHVWKSGHLNVEVKYPKYKSPLSFDISEDGLIRGCCINVDPALMDELFGSKRA